MDYQNYLYLEYRRALGKFRKLQTRFEKRVANNTFQELTTRRRHKLLSQLRKLKQKIEQLTGRLKLAAAGGSLAFTMGLALATPDAEAQGAPGTPKNLTIDKTRANSITTGSQQDPDVDINNDGNFAIVWKEDDWSLRGKAYGGDVDESLDFDIPSGAGANANPAIAINDENEFVVTWQESAFAIKYMRYEVDNGELLSDGPYTATTGAESVHDPAVDIDAEGNFVIAWNQNNGDVPGIKARYYDANNFSNTVLEVSDNTEFDQNTASVDMDNEGNFIVVWKDQEQPDPFVSVIRGKKYKDGLPVSGIMDLHEDSDDETYNPTVDLNGDGSFVVAWEYAYFPGSVEYIRAQIYDSDGNSRIDGDITIGASPYTGNPNVAADKDGGFVVVYDAYDGAEQKILGNRYNRFGDPIESFEFYNQSEAYNLASNPAIGMNDRGDFMVAWDDNIGAIQSEGGCPSGADCDQQAIYFKKYSGPENEPYCIEDSHLVSTHPTGSKHSASIDVDADGNYVIVWEGDWWTSYEEGSGIAGQRYFSDGTKNGDEFQINTTTDGSQNSADVSLDSDGDFIVVWRSYDSYQMGYDVMAQYFNADATKNGVEFEIDNEEQEYGGPDNPSVDLSDDGEAVVVWEGGEYQGVFGRVVTGPRAFDDDVFKIDASTSSGHRESPEVASDNDGNFVVVWAANDSEGYNQVYSRRFDNSATALDAEDVTVSSGSNNNNDRYHSVDMDKGKGDFIVAFSEYNGDNHRVLASRFDKNGGPRFEKEIITESAYTLANPHVAFNDLGDYAISWDHYDLGKSVGFSVFHSDDEPWYESKVDNNATSDQHSGPAIALDNDADAILVFENNNRGYSVFSKKVSRPLSGQIDAGIEFIVNSTTSNDQINPDVAQNADGDFVVVWTDYDNGSDSFYDVKAQRYNNEGIRQGEEIMVNTMRSGVVSDPVVALNDDGDFMVVWSEYGNANGDGYDIMGRAFSWDAIDPDDDFIINDDLDLKQTNPDIAINPEGEFQVIWSENYNGDGQWNRIYGQRVSSDGVPYEEGNQFLIEIQESGPDINLQSSIAINSKGDMAIPIVYNPDGTENGLYVFRSSLDPIISNIWFSETSYVDSNGASVTANEDGEFVLAWSDYDLGTGTYELKTRKYIGGESFDDNPIVVQELEDRTTPSIASVDDGDYIIIYTDNPDESEYNVHVRRLDSDFETIGPNVQINEIDASQFKNNAIASSPDGSYTVVWQSYYADGDGETIMARQFVSHKPTIDNQGLTLDENAESAISSAQLTVENPYGDSDEVYVTITSLPQHGVLTFDSQDVTVLDEFDLEELLQVTYTQDGSETIEDSFDFSAANEDFETGEHLFMIDITPVNDEPEVDNPIADQVGEEDVAFSFTLPENVFSDAEFDELTLSATLADGSPLPEWLTFTGATGQFSGTPSNGGDLTIKVTASDGQASVSDEFALSIVAVNDGPMVANALEDQSTDQFEPYSFVIPENTFSDADGEDLSLSASLADDSALPAWLTFNELTRTLAGTPSEHGAIDIKIMAHDGEGQSVTSTFKLTINFVLSAMGLGDQEVQYYPNPVESTLHLRPDARMTGDIQVYLFNQSGKVMNRSVIRNISNAQVFDIDVQNLRQGIYFVKMVDENTTATFKISKK